MKLIGIRRNEEKTVIVVHPHPQKREQLHNRFSEAGYNVLSFARLNKANLEIAKCEQDGRALDCIIVPAKLNVYLSYTYKEFLKTTFPQYQIMTVDHLKDYRDSLNLKLSKFDYINQLFQGELK